MVIERNQSQTYNKAEELNDEKLSQLLEKCISDLNSY
jgi:hypothetical protein